MDSDFVEFKHLFPPETKIISFTGSVDNYVANLRCKCKNKEDFSQNWLKQYGQISGVTLRLQLTRRRCGKTVVYKAAYRCERNTYPSSHRRVKSSYKHTDCRAIMRVTIKSSIENRRVRSNDSLRGDYPTLITIEHNHNHRIEPANAPEMKDISKKEETYDDTPAIAVQLQEEEVIDECLDYYEDLADSSLYPDLQIVYNFSDSDMLQEIELTTHHVEVITEPFVIIKQDDQEHRECLWSSIQDRWKGLFEKWQKENSIAQYNALVEALTFLESCQTETAAISALQCLGKSFKAKKNGRAAAGRSMQSDSIAKFSLSDHNYSKQKDPQNKQFSYALQGCEVQEFLLEQ